MSSCLHKSVETGVKRMSPRQGQGSTGVMFGHIWGRSCLSSQDIIISFFVLLLLVYKTFSQYAS